MAISAQGLPLSPSERFFLINTFLRGSYESSVQTLNFILDHFVTIQQTIPSMDQLFTGLRAYIASYVQQNIMKEIEDRHALSMDSSLRQLIIVERIMASPGTATLQQKIFQIWLNARLIEEPEPGQGNALKAVNIIILIGLLVLHRIVGHPFI